MWHFFCERIHQRSTVLPATLAQMHTHLVLIKNLWVCVLRHCCVTPDFVAWKKKSRRAWQTGTITGLTGTQKKKQKMWKVSLRDTDAKKRRQWGKNKTEHKLEERETRQQQDWGLHSNDVTSRWHCWTQKWISHLIFALILVPVSSFQLNQPAYWDK